MYLNRISAGELLIARLVVESVIIIATRINYLNKETNVMYFRCFMGISL